MSSLNCLRLPIFYVLHVTPAAIAAAAAAAAAVLFISNGASSSDHPPPRRPRTGCMGRAGQGAVLAAAYTPVGRTRPPRPLHLSKKRKKLFFRRLSYLEQTRSPAPTDGRADDGTDGRSDMGGAAS